MESILEIKNLHTYFYTEDSVIKAVEGVSLSVAKEEILGLVGESACGKTVTALSVMRLIQPPGRIVNGRIFFEGRDLLKLSGSDMRSLRGGAVSMVFQEPSSSLNPLYTIGFQIGEMIKIHNKGIAKAELNSLTLELLRKVEIPQPEVRIKDYPHNLSGGQAQRVMIAMAISCNPKLLIADEPTTALDVTIQAQIMDLFMRLREKTKFSLILITHDLTLCSQVADRIAVMYAGKVVELASTRQIFHSPLHPYTKALLSSMPQEGKHKQRFKVIDGAVPASSCKPSGCHFHPRCPVEEHGCEAGYPEYREVTPGHWVSCHKVNSK